VVYVVGRWCVGGVVFGWCGVWVVCVGWGGVGVGVGVGMGSVWV
jgi:hypothetical protein